MLPPPPLQTEQGLVHMSVKVPFPDSAIANDGKCQNLIGRILGPRGISVRQLEMQYGCKILIRGKGSVKVCVWVPIGIGSRQTIDHFLRMSQRRSVFVANRRADIWTSSCTC